MSAKTSVTMMSALAGAAVWSVLCVLAGTGHAPFGIIELLFLFAPLVIVPLGMELGRSAISAEWASMNRVAAWLQPIAATLVIAAFWFPPGRAAALLCLPWACVCGLLALGSALATLRWHGSFPAALAHVGRFDLVIAAAWLLMSRSGVHPQQFQEPIILLTAVHFHFSGFGLATIAAATLHDARLRGWRSRALTSSALLAVFLPFLLAAGFVFSPTLKVVAAAAFAVSVVIFAVLLLQFSSGLLSRTARSFLRLASAFVTAGMLLAMIYALGDYLGEDWLVIPWMASTHGVLNGLGFVLPGLLGWLAEFHVSSSEGHDNAFRASSEDRHARPVELKCGGLTFSARDFYDR
jgi:hypothetical protein